LLVDFFSALETHGTFKDALIACEGLVDDVDVDIMQVAAAITAFGEGFAGFV
jgi:hypothetical protein